MRLFIGLTAAFFCFAATVHGEDATPQTAPADTAAARADGDEPNATEKETVEFGDQTLVQAFQQADVFGDTIKEFIPAGETLEHWTRLAAVFEYPRLSDPKGFAEGMIEELKEKNPDCDYKLLENSTEGECILCFFIQSDDRSFCEYNQFLYRKNGEQGLIAYQYAKRAYGDDQLEFVNGMDADRRVELLVDLLKGVAKMNGVDIEEQTPADTQ